MSRKSRRRAGRFSRPCRRNSNVPGQQESKTLPRNYETASKDSEHSDGWKTLLPGSYETKDSGEIVRVDSDVDSDLAFDKLKEALQRLT